MKNRKIEVFLRTTVIFTVIMMCVIFLLVSFCEIYENIRFIAYGEYKNAIEITESGVRILDFYIG